MRFLNKINSPADVKKVKQEDLPRLAAEVRGYMVDCVSKTGGHLAPSLGVVELMIALCRTFDFPKDKIIFDVGHQSYAYKILTGRRKEFRSLRQMDGISGFPKREESIYDSFNTGHSSTSVSAALGLAVARDLKGEDYKVLSVIGDGALTGGMAYEALNNAGSRRENLIVILNDNQMSISPNVGAMSNYLAKARTAPRYGERKQDLKRVLDRSGSGQKVLSGLKRVRDSVKYLLVDGMLFEELGFTYLGPVDGHDIESLEKFLSYAAAAEGPVLVHVLTRKGKGYSFAEKEPDRFHGIGVFDKKTGKSIKKSDLPSFSSVFGNHLTALAEKDDRITAITAAMPGGTGLQNFADKYPGRFFDVGIAEPHAVTYAAGLAANGLKPCAAVYSSFLQRAVDQIYHDVCLQNLPVVFGIDRAGVVGEDGETHQGIYDISLLRSFPGMTLLAPSTQKDLEMMLDYAFSLEGPCALRYARGSVSNWDENYEHPPLTEGGELLADGEDLLLVPLGSMIEETIKARDLLKESGIDAAVYNPRFIKPLDKDTFVSFGERYRLLVTVEDHVTAGGFGSAVGEILAASDAGARLHCLGLPDEPVRQGSRSLIMKKYGLDAEGIASSVFSLFHGTAENDNVK